MIRRIYLCSRVLRHLVHAEHLQFNLRYVLPLSRHDRLCHQQSKTAQPVPILKTTSSTKTDTFLEEIKGLNNLQEMVACIEQNKEHIQSCHLDHVFTKLYLMAKEHPSIVEEIQAERSFAVLCQYTLKHIRQFDKVEIVYLIRALCSLKVPLDCMLGQASLQMLRHSINSLSLSHITIMDYVLRNQPPNLLVDALKKALPLALEIHISYQLDPNNLWLVMNCLSMAVKHNLDMSVIENLGSIVHQNVESLSKAKTIHAVTTLSHLKPLPQNLRVIVRELLSRLNYFIMELSELETKNILHALKNKHFFHSKLLSSLSHRCCTEHWDLQATTHLLSVYNYHKFLSTSALNWILENIHRDQAQFCEDESVSLLTICEALSEANHSVDRKSFTSLIQKCGDKLEKLEKDAPKLLVKLAMHLAILECIPLELMAKVLHPEFISEVKKSVVQKDQMPSLLQCYLTLEQSARLSLQPHYRGPFLPPDVLNEAISVRATVMKPIDSVLEKFLETGLGGPQSMLTGLWTKLGHFIDHLVVMRKEDLPFQLDNKEELIAVKNPDGFTYIEDVILPENSKVLAVLVARQEWFSKDPKRLRGWMSFQQKMLAKMGYNPVIIGPPTENADQIQDIDCRMENESV